MSITTHLPTSGVWKAELTNPQRKVYVGINARAQIAM